MKKELFWIALGISLGLSSVTFLPLSLDLIILLYVRKKAAWILSMAFFVGLMLDILLVRPLAHTALFFLISIFFIFLYERKYEIRSRGFVFFFTFLTGLIYLEIFYGGFMLVAALLNAFVALGLYYFVFEFRNARLGRF